MSRAFRLVGAWVLAAVAVGVLTLGAREAFATPAATTCPNDGWNTMGEQPSWEACWEACVAVHQENLVDIGWNPFSHCCNCYY